MTSYIYYYAAIIAVQLAYAGSNIIVKIALHKGLNQFVFVVYRHLIGMILLGPIAYCLERKQRPPLSLAVISKIFLLALLGTTTHLNLFYVGLMYTSATLASALNNVIPGLTFLMAVLLRMEKIEISSARGQAKVLGTLICIAGSLVCTFWKGGFLYKGIEKMPLISPQTHDDHAQQDSLKGSALLLISYIAWSGWLILQALVYKVYPAPLSMTTLICFFASIQSSILALIFGRNPTFWKLEWNLELLTILYCGVVISGIVYCLLAWCISNKGPVFAAMFSPLVVVIVAIFSAIAFAERLHVGSFVGALLIISGLYCVLWGKSHDHVTAQVPMEEKDIAERNGHPLKDTEQV
ncbi:WAT1-related protein At5g64700-like [Mercurialis annua]|uniref:WAT1-related protein At5g64700-like n=1 Tax=Mercurialis annua TaxID=3986 RepID=UPI00216092C2|nr:WAT1-related protein At5g64700-like [Mercurialis annua]